MSISPSSVFTRLAAGVLAAASLTTLAVAAEAAAEAAAGEDIN